MINMVPKYNYEIGYKALAGEDTMTLIGDEDGTLIRVSELREAYLRTPRINHERELRELLGIEPREDTKMTNWKRTIPQEVHLEVAPYTSQLRLEDI